MISGTATKQRASLIERSVPPRSLRVAPNTIEGSLPRRPCGLTRAVVDAPCLGGLSGLAQSGEYVFIEALVAHSATEALDEAVLHRLAWRDAAPLDALVGRPAQRGVSGQLRAVVRDDHRRLTADGDDGRQLADAPAGPTTRRPASFTPTSHHRPLLPI